MRKDVRMGLFRRGERIAAEPAPTTVEIGVDLARLERLADASVRLRDRGITYEAIEQRAATDGVSLNQALEALDREQTDA